MFGYFPYIIIIITAVILFIMLYIKIKYKFWAEQPVFHVYNINYMLFPPGIIDENLPTKNKYTNFTNIETIDVSKLSQLKRTDIVHFIQLNYYQNGENKYLTIVTRSKKLVET